MSALRNATSAVSADLDARSRKIAAQILQSLASAGQAPVAAAIGASESTVSRMKSEGEIERLALLLAACGLKVVPADWRVFDPADVAVLLHGAKRWLAAMHEPGELSEKSD